jgi:hypothetical protein
MADMKEKLVELLHIAHKKVADVALEDDEKTYSDAVGMEADELIAHGVTVQEWISVKDRLPENREDVLVVAFWHERWNVQWGWYAPHGRVWHVGLMEETDYPVSHWMPLPKPPKGE